MAAAIMRQVHAVATNIVSSLGLDTDAHWNAVSSGQLGVRQYQDSALSETPFYASRIDPAQWQRIYEHTKSSRVLSPFEQMSIFSARQALAGMEEPVNPDETVLILSTTKGNIEWLNQVPDERILLHTSAGVIAKELGLTHKPLVVSHACVSGVVAALYGLRLLQSGKYSHAVIVGADRFSRFVLSGFQSFQAISDEPCKPFDIGRKGINLGEAAATIVLSTAQRYQGLARLVSGSTSNDANHISGPSRTGEELALAIQRACDGANITPGRIGMISAHGTATIYNDEMESRAFGLMGLTNTPVHSFKGYIGHTLGAAGILESAMIIESLLRQETIASAGFTEIGVSQVLNVTRSSARVSMDYVLKTASGFGGCNATALWARA